MVKPKPACHEDRLVLGLGRGNRHRYAGEPEVFQHFPYPRVWNRLLRAGLRIGLPVMREGPPGEDFIVSQYFPEGFEHGRSHQAEQIRIRGNRRPHGSQGKGCTSRYTRCRIEECPVHVEQHAAEGCRSALERLVPKYHHCVLSFWSRADSCLLLGIHAVKGGHGPG